MVSSCCDYKQLYKQQLLCCTHGKRMLLRRIKHKRALVCYYRVLCISNIEVLLFTHTVIAQEVIQPVCVHIAAAGTIGRTLPATIKGTCQQPHQHSALTGRRASCTNVCMLSYRLHGRRFASSCTRACSRDNSCE